MKNTFILIFGFIFLATGCNARGRSGGPEHGLSMLDWTEHSAKNLKTNH